ncbi:MAG: CBS domain-containing protein [Caldilineaceae bacterium]
MDAYNYMTENDIWRLPVTDKDNLLLGILTMSDIQRTVPLFSE